MHERVKARTLNYHAQSRKSWRRYRSVVRRRPLKYLQGYGGAAAEAIDRCRNSKQEMYSIDRIGGQGQQRVDIYRRSWEFARRFIVERSTTWKMIASQSNNVLFSRERGSLYRACIYRYKIAYSLN